MDKVTLHDKKPVSTIPITIDTTSLDTTVVNKIINHILKKPIPPPPPSYLSSTAPISISTLTSITTYFKLNDFLFLLSAEGNLYKISNYLTKNNTMLFNPCLGVTSVGPPIYNVTNNITPPGFSWSNSLQAFYQNRYSVTDRLKTSCYNSHLQGCEGCFCSDSYKEEECSHSADCYNLDKAYAKPCYIVTQKSTISAGEFGDSNQIYPSSSECGINYKSNTTNRSGSIGDCTSCSTYCAVDTSNVDPALKQLQTENNLILVCNNTGSPEHLTNVPTSVKKPGWVKYDGSNSSTFQTLATNIDGENNNDCVKQPIVADKYCTIPVN